MNTYSIWEGNIEKLRSKVATIQKKCVKNGCTFVYREVGEEFEEYVDDQGQTWHRKFILVEVEGTAIVNGWQFLATVQHLAGGKVITKADADIEIPNRFYSMDPICEHCNSTRNRKDTYIVYNQETKEYKMVGKSCLREYTNGLSAELVASYLSYFKEVEDMENFFPAQYSRGEQYHLAELILAYAVECVHHFGYYPSTAEGYTTKQRVDDYYSLAECGWAFNQDEKDRIRREMEMVKFNIHNERVETKVQAILDWINTKMDDSEYFQNLKTLRRSKYITYRNFGIWISAVKAYDKEMAYEEKKAREAKKTAASAHQGRVGEKLTFDAVEVKVLSCYETQWDYSYFYQMIDAQGNVYTWSTSKGLDPDKKYTVTGTVKKHEEYRGVKQTQLTRCKVTEIKEG